MPLNIRNSQLCTGHQQQTDGPDLFLHNAGGQICPSHWLEAHFAVDGPMNRSPMNREAAMTGRQRSKLRETWGSCPGFATARKS